MPSQIYIIDTSPFLDYLILSLIQKKGKRFEKPIEDNSRLSNFFRIEPAKRSDFLQFIENLQGIIVTSPTITEIQGLQTLRGDYAKEFWQITLNFFAQEKVEEAIVNIKDLQKNSDYVEIIKKIGITDTTIIAVAEQRRLPILTSDERTLLSFANARTIKCETLEMILNG